jgi:hypothetical protein
MLRDGDAKYRGGKRRQTRCREGDFGSASKQYQRCYGNQCFSHQFHIPAAGHATTVPR